MTGRWTGSNWIFDFLLVSRTQSPPKTVMSFVWLASFLFVADADADAADGD